MLQIASGSKGNATFIQTEYAKVIIDAGISKKRIVECLEKNKFSLDDIDAIFLTHEHTDHTGGLVPLYNATGAMIYTTRGTYEGLATRIKERIPKSSFRFVENDEDLLIGDLDVQCIQTFHDALDPIGFVFESSGKKLVYITDTGYVHHSFFEKLSNAHMYIWESNHDPEILMNSDRPYDTIMRILSDHGHMSNQDSAYALANLIGVNTKNVVFAHISEECNLVQIVRLTSSRVFKDLGIDTSEISFHYASQIPLEVFEI